MLSKITQVKAVSKTGDTNIMKILCFTYLLSKKKILVKLQFHSLSLEQLSIPESEHEGLNPVVHT